MIAFSLFLQWLIVDSVLLVRRWVGRCVVILLFSLLGCFTVAIAERRWFVDSILLV